MSVLVTGGAGFIGSHISEQLLNDGEEVIIFDNLSTGNLDNISQFRENIQFVEGDIRDQTALHSVMSGVTHVFHEAALVSVQTSVDEPALNHAVNITGVLNVLETARRCGVQRCVLASSAAVYGNAPELPKKEDMLPQPASPYAVAKTCDEYYARVYSQLYGLPTVCLRYFNVYGPRQDPRSMYSGVISRFAEQIKQGKQPTIFGDGYQTRDFIYVADVVEANRLVMQSEHLGNGDIINVGTGQSISLLDLVEVLSQITRQDIAPAFAEARPGDVRHSLADVSRLQKCTGFTPRFDTAEGLRRLLADEAKEN